MLSFRQIAVGAVISLNFLFLAWSSEEEPLPKALERAGRPPIFEEYAWLLWRFVDDGGTVRYQELKARRDVLDILVEKLKDFKLSTYKSWDEKSKVAFWINTYNVLTLRVVIDNYPIRASFLSSFRFPHDSIRQISGVWDELQFRVMGRDLTLDDIEHSIIRSEFREPRVHMALVCAARSCPPLRNEPYSGENLDAQLDDQTRIFLRDKQRFYIDRGRERVYLSKIFDWYGKDFVTSYGEESEGDIKASVMSFVSSYLDQSDRKYLEEGDYIIAYLKYDWSLNDRKD